MPSDDAQWMQQALVLARRGLGSVWPNPSVGCVLVREGKLIAKGWTQPSGRPHAETIALGEAGPAAKGATAYVSLEPCDHWGETSPCSLDLIEAGISRVVVATVDPDPRVNGGGIARMRKQGLQVEVGLFDEEAQRLNIGFFTRVRQGRPHVALVRPDGHGAHLREYDALLTDRTGLNTILRQPLDRLPRLLIVLTQDATKHDGVTPPDGSWIVVPADQPAATGDENTTRWTLLRAAADRRYGVNIRALLGMLGSRGLTRLAIDAGCPLASPIRELKL